MYLITGASKGIGRLLFDYYTSKGQVVFGTYNRSKIVEPRNLGKVDVRSYEEVNKWISSLIEIEQPEELILINCAGISYNALAHKADLQKWEDVISVNLIGSFNTIRACLPYMREKNYGRIINFSSVVPQKGVIGTSAYSASKAGLWGLAKTVAVENASKGITINNINLGYFNIGMIEQVPEEFLGKIVAQIPLGKLGSPENIIQTVEYLQSNDYITGASIDVNGGLH
ncbi:MAG: beta-ketoacyl-ACP reductase [Ignavibacteriales bacterium]